MLNINNIENQIAKRMVNDPFKHVEIDEFLLPSTAEKICSEFPDFGSDVWYSYKNQIEDKKALNDWNKFPELTYKLFSLLTGNDFVSRLSRCFGVELFPDPGLHGAGWHIHGSGGKLNPHLDYNIHPKIGLQRKLNLILYLCQDWQETWGGHFGLWKQNEITKRPGDLVKEISMGFNKAVIFDTTQNSWHGLSREVSTPENKYRKSLAVYYLCVAPEGSENRGRALFAPTTSQKDDKSIEDLIDKRSRVASSHEVYRMNENK